MTARRRSVPRRRRRAGSVGSAGASREQVGHWGAFVDHARPRRGAMAGHDATAGASWRYIDDRVSGYDNDPSGAPQYELPDYAVLDLRGLRDLGGAEA